jgi:two-component system sensor histidine kinase GlrK
MHAMRVLLPSTITQLTYVAVFVLVAPLGLALAVALYQMNGLALLGGRNVMVAQQETEHARLLADQLAEFERSALELEESPSPQSREDYEVTRAQFAESLDASAAMTKLHTTIAALHAEASEIQRRLNEPNVRPGATLAIFKSMYPSVQALIDESDRKASSYARQPLAAASRVESALLWFMAAALPAALLFGFVLVRRITGSLRSLDLAIRHLGEGELDDPVRIEGPADLVELGSQLDRMRARLVGLERQKASFLRSISHELKTPLTSIREGAHLLRFEDPSADAADRRKISQIIYESSTRLHALIDRLIQLGRTSGQPAFSEFSDIQLDAIIRSVLRDHRLAIDARNIDLITDVESVVISGNADLLGNLVDNLVSNAVKFCNANGRISVRLRQTAGTAIIDVEDSGPGIAEHERDRIFEEFYHGSAVATGALQGTGVGLTIARESAQWHGGDIEVISASRGAHLRSTLPLMRTVSVASDAIDRTNGQRKEIRN